MSKIRFTSTTRTLRHSLLALIGRHRQPSLDIHYSDRQT
jgi:hypothetical protein